MHEQEIEHYLADLGQELQQRGVQHPVRLLCPLLKAASWSEASRLTASSAKPASRIFTSAPYNATSLLTVLFAPSLRLRVRVCLTL